MEWGVKKKVQVRKSHWQSFCQRPVVFVGWREERGWRGRLEKDIAAQSHWPRKEREGEQEHNFLTLLKSSGWDSSGAWMWNCKASTWKYNLFLLAKRRGLQVGTGIICIMQCKLDGNNFRKAYDCCNHFKLESKIWLLCIWEFLPQLYPRW